MKTEINTLKRHPAGLPDMNACNSSGPQTLRWGEDCAVSILHIEAIPLWRQVDS